MQHSAKEIFDWVIAAKKPLAWLTASGVLLVLCRWVFRMFIQATDVDCGYNWSFDGTMNDARNMRPNFDVRNRSQSRTYRLANINYTLRGVQHWCDNQSVWGKELKPGSIEFIDGIAPVPRLDSLKDCVELTVTLRFQNNREIRGHGPGQQQTKWQHKAARLRVLLDKASISLD